MNFAYHRELNPATGEPWRTGDIMPLGLVSSPLNPKPQKTPRRKRPVTQTACARAMQVPVVIVANLGTMVSTVWMPDYIADIADLAFRTIFFCIFIGSFFMGQIDPSVKAANSLSMLWGSEVSQDCCHSRMSRSYMPTAEI